LLSCKDICRETAFAFESIDTWESRIRHCGIQYQKRGDLQIPSGEATPQFRKHEEATNGELFYDLFFVANLTVFTDFHEVNSKETL
jgi:hypothetical protein